MEEWVGSIWHRYITKKASTEYDEARVTFNDISHAAGVMFRALGGDPGKRVEAASARDYLVRRTLLQKISGSYQQFSLAWQDGSSLRLPQSLAVFPDKNLNRELYLWLSAMAAQRSEPFNHWAADNQAIVLEVFRRFAGLKKRYFNLVKATLATRPPVEYLPKAQQPLEKAIIQALVEPGSVSEFPAANYAPQAIYLWLYPSARIDAPPPNGAEPPAPKSNSSKQAKSASPRKQTERVDDPQMRDGLMLFRLENLFSWSEFVKVNRAADDTEDEDAQRVAEDLDKITVSQNQDQKSGKLKIDLDLPSASEDDIPLGPGIHLPEFDYKTGQLVPERCLLYPMLPKDAKPAKIPVELAVSARRLRHQFEQLRNVRHWEKAQPQGEELDLNAWLDFHIQRQHGPTAEAGLYRSFKSNRRDLCSLLLADISMSTDAHIDNENRVIDVVQNSLLLFSEALSAVGDPFAMYGFSSVKRHNVRFTLLKNFAEKYSDHVRGRILALRPGFYTRMGAAVRQASRVLSTQSQSQKLLLIITDGKPNDIDHYEGRHGIEDTREAIREAKRQGLKPFCITIDTEAEQYLPYIFGSDGYAVIHNPAQLPTRLPMLYHQLTN